MIYSYLVLFFLTFLCMLHDVWQLNLCSCILFKLIFCLKFESLTKMAGPLAEQELAQPAACYKVLRSGPG